jgi:tetratricopeptide (TPR) repeat protein
VRSPWRKPDEALGQFEEALRLDPGYANAHNGMGLALHEKGKPDEAMERYKEALHLNPKHATAQVNLGAMLAEKKQFDEAIRNYDAALRINHSYAPAHYHYGNALRARNELARAIGQYQEALKLSPQYTAAHNALGNAYNALGNAYHAKNQFDQAIDHYKQATLIEPGNTTFRVNLGNVLRLKGRLDEAITQFQEALRINSENAQAHNGLGNTLSAKGDPDAALPHYEKATLLNPKIAQFHVNLGNTLSALGRHDAAISEHKKALQIDPKNSVAQNGLGSGFLGKGKVDRAIGCFERAIQLNDKNSTAHGNLGIARLYGQGRTAEARDCFKRAAEIHPNNAVTQYNVGQGLMADGRFTEAGEAVYRALGLLGTDRRYRDVYHQTMRQLYDADPLPAMAARLPAIIEKKEKPADAAEALKFAWLCQVKLRFAAAARLYADGFASDPKPANELSAGYRLNAARCAALATAGWGQDSPKPSDAERTRLRGQTLEWLRADLAAWQKQVASADPEALSAARRTLTLWLKDFRFFAVREKEELAKLQDTERTAWEKLWADTEALRVKARTTQPVGRWVALGLPVVEGLELWLGAARLNPARQARGLAPLKDGDPVETWFDDSGQERHVGQPAPAARPRLVRVGPDWLLRFDGADDHLRRTGMNRSLDACTVFVVAAPHANPGGFRAFLAANEAGKNDAQTGFNIDMGPGATAQFDWLNVEGSGFSGIQNLLDRPGPFGTLHVLELVADPGRRTVRLILDGRPSRGRSLAPAPISLDEFTVGARYTSLRGEPLHACGSLPGDISEVLVYSRALRADETKAVRQYLERKYARLKEALPRR